MAKGVKTGGRQPGSPNRVTRDVRAAIAIIAENNIDTVQTWLHEIEDPGKRLDLFIRLLEYHVPKLARTEMTGKDGGALVYVFEKIDEQ